ncbi:MAG TPA: thiamine-phosphate kinase [Stellaceae bacterium]|nr:thiamine-phosphate kinase [Stellaceae bacterium]
MSSAGPRAANGARLGEVGRIQTLLAPLATSPGALGLTDDAALIDPPAGSELVTTVDAMIEGVHFLPDDPPDLVARKLMRVNLSDLASMAAKPLGYLLTLGLPSRCGDDWVERFAQGLAIDQQAFGMTLLGGDSVSTPGPISLTLTAIGYVMRGRAVRRAGAKPGDLVFVSGTIGDGALGLLAATGRLPDLDAAAWGWLADRYRLPRPRCVLGQALGAHAAAMIDVSDGLVADLGHITAASGVGAVLDAAKVPLSEAAMAVLARDPGQLATVLTGGDDYELLFAASPEQAEPIRRLAHSLGVAVAEIGRIETGRGVRVLDEKGAVIPLDRPGWQHC